MLDPLHLIDELDLITVDVGDESNGVKMVEETNSRIVDLADLDLVEGDVGTEAHGIKIIG